jgi:NitT/TauT family transport system ATP-binding protein
MTNYEMSKTTIVELKNVSFCYGRGAPVLSDVDFHVDAGEIVALVGPSGCGKSTLLRVMAQLEEPQEGVLLFGPRRLSAISRLLFQDYDAFPWLTVRDNVLKGSGPKPFPTGEAVDAVLSAVGLQHHRHAFPNELSGGLRKRLALARILVREPSLVMLDEPFASLDVDTRSSIYQLVQLLWARTNGAVVMVTHDVHEAILLATRVDVASTRPMQIGNSFNIPFSRPRDESIVETGEYRDVRRQIMAALSSHGTPSRTG